MIIKPIVRMVLRIASFVLYGLTILSAYCGHINPAITAIPAVMVMMMPYLAILTALAAVAWLVSGKWITGALGIGSLIAASAPILSAVPLKLPNNPTDGKTEFSVLSWNCLHGWDQKLMTGRSDRPENQLYNESLEFMLNSGADIICLQEMEQWEESEVPRLTQDFKEKFAVLYRYESHEVGKDTRVFSKYPVHNLPARQLAERNGVKLPDDWRMLLKYYSFYRVNIDGRRLLLVNMHLFSPGLSDKEREVITDIRGTETVKASAREFKNSILGKMRNAFSVQARQLELLCEILKDYKDPIVVCGDMNNVPESYTWRVMTRNGFKDAYSEVGFGHLITYNKHLFWLHLDQIMYRGALRPLKVTKDRIKTSDHFPLMASFEFE